MPKKVTSKRKVLPKTSKEKFLSTVPYESGFHFYTSVGNSTGITATSLAEFAAKLQIAPLESVEFHFQRKDFQKWLAETIGDKELAEAMSLFGAAHFAEDLRNTILRVVQERIAELTRSSIANRDALKQTVPLQI